MEHQQDWYNPAVIKRVRKSITIILVVITSLILALNYTGLLKLYNNIFN